MNPASVSEALSAAQLDAVSALWQRDRRSLAASFTGTSMLPAIAPGQQVVIECGAVTRVGDVIVYLIDKQPRVHRVVALTGNWLLTWGDANPLPDLPADPASIIGTVRQVPPKPSSLFRIVLVWLIASRSTPRKTLARRIERMYGARAAWIRGPAVFATKVIQSYFRR